MSTDRWMDKTAVIHIYNEILFSYEKEHIWASVNEVDEPRAYYTEWSQSERKKQVIYIYNLERWYWWTYLQGRNEDADGTDLWTQWQKERVGQMEKVALTYIHYDV